MEWARSSGFSDGYELLAEFLGHSVRADGLMTQCVSRTIRLAPETANGDCLCHVCGCNSRFCASAAWHGLCNEG